MKIAVCDDDKAAREHIVSLIKEQDASADITVFADGEERWAGWILPTGREMQLQM